MACETYSLRAYKALSRWFLPDVSLHRQAVSVSASQLADWLNALSQDRTLHSQDRTLHSSESVLHMSDTCTIACKVLGMKSD